MSSFSNGDGYQAKGVGGGAGGFHCTMLTRPESVFATADISNSEVKESFGKRFLKLPAYAKDHICKMFKPTGDILKGSAIEVVEIGRSKKRSQDKRASLLDPTVATPSKKRLEKGALETTNDGEMMIVFQAEQEAVGAGNQAGKNVTGRTEETRGMGSDVMGESSTGTPHLSESISSPSSPTSSLTSPSPITSSSLAKTRRNFVGLSGKRRFLREKQERVRREAEREKQELIKEAHWCAADIIFDLKATTIRRPPGVAELKFHKLNASPK